MVHGPEPPEPPERRLPTFRKPRIMSDNLRLRKRKKL